LIVRRGQQISTINPPVALVLRGDGVIVVGCIVFIAAAMAPEQSSAVSPRVRPQSSKADEVVRDAVRRSPTVAALLAGLDDSDLIVLVDLVNDPGTFLARTAIIGATDQSRFLHIALNSRLSADRMVELLGHELQHATEIADAPDIRDDLTLARAYTRLGWQFESGHFETDLARATEQIVRLELHAWRESPRYRKKD
jgi:hypothetical protein